MHGLYFVPALSIASLTPHSYAQFQSKATPVESISVRDQYRIPLHRPPRKNWDSTRPSYLILIFAGKTHMTDVAFLASSLGQCSIKLRSPTPNPADARTHLAYFGIQIGHDHIVPCLPCLSQYVSVGVQNHGIARPNLIVVKAHPIAENEKDSIVVGTGGKPLQ